MKGLLFCIKQPSILLCMMKHMDRETILAIREISHSADLSLQRHTIVWHGNNSRLALTASAKNATRGTAIRLKEFRQKKASVAGKAKRRLAKTYTLDREISKLKREPQNTRKERRSINGKIDRRRYNLEEARCEHTFFTLQLRGIEFDVTRTAQELKRRKKGEMKWK
jgi:hypothetical protein